MMIFLTKMVACSK